MYSDLIKRLRIASRQASMTGSKTWGHLMREASDAVEALERNKGCPAWDKDKYMCTIMNMPVWEDRE